MIGTDSGNKELKKQKLQEEKEGLRQFHRAIFAMVLPIAFQNFMTAAVSASDAVMLGFLEQEALSAFCLGLPVLAVYLIICLDEGIKVPVVLWYYRKYTWARNLTH